MCCCRVVTPNRTFYMYSSSVSETNSWVALIRSKVVSHTYSELFMYMYMYLYQYIIDIKYMYCTLHTCNMCSGLAFSVHLYMYTRYFQFHLIRLLLIGLVCEFGKVLYSCNCTCVPYCQYYTVNCSL